MSASQATPDFEALLEYLKRNRGFDFTGYKRPSLIRRIQKRMDAVSVTTYGEYQDYLEVHPEEFRALFNTVLINVTAFFRDAEAWKYIAAEVLPRLLARKDANGAVRVWSAGCASGEEAYTLAILLAEATGVSGFRDRVKIYATDVDQDALTKARQGIYTETEVQDVPEQLLGKYFDVVDGSYHFRKDLRRQIIFGRHDLIDDAPISRVDLLVCRNTLMYLNAETQARILARFHFALADGGILFLGRAETLLTHASTFEPVDLKHRISTKISRGALPLRDRLLLMAEQADDDASALFSDSMRLRELAMDAAPVAQIVISADDVLIHANERARSLFVIPAGDLGKPLQDLRVSYRPVELRSLLNQSRLEARPVIVREVEWQPTAGDVRYMDVYVYPLLDAGAQIGCSITFTDVTTAKRLQRDLEHARQDLETAYEELQSTNEELETTNEELQSTVEELETTNEELQSTNEELETMNEELQSTNEVLTTMNEELRDRGHELSDLNLFLESVLSSIDAGVVVVDSELHIRTWSKKARDMWGLREDEVVGKHLLGLDVGFPVGQLRLPLKQVLSSRADEPIAVFADATSRRGRPIHCRIAISALRQPGGETRGAILLMEDADRDLEPQTAAVGHDVERVTAEGNGRS